MEPKDLERQVAELAALGEPVRRSLYFYVAGRRGEVSRDEAAEAVGISRTLAGFHLDRLARDGLLETSFRRLTGKTGPGAGRPAKLYRRAEREVSVSLPQRSYQLAAQILAGTVARGDAPETRAALQATAREVGERLGGEVRAVAGPRGGRKRRLEAAVAALAAQGYEPETAQDAVRLRNCPFHALVGRHRELVCGMNLALIQGMVDGAGLEGVEPALDPQPGMCCVALRRRGGRGKRAGSRPASGAPAPDR